MSVAVNTRDEIEFTIIGTLLREPEHMGEAMAKLTLADFESMGAQGIFRAMGALFLADKPITEVTVLAEAGDDYRGVVALAAWSKYYTTRIDYYFDLLVRQSKLALARTLGNDLAVAESEEAAEAILGRLNGAFSGRRSVEIVSMQDAALHFFDTHADGVSPKHLPWGFQELNEKLTVSLGAFVVIGGYPSAGKTLLSLQMSLNLAKEYRVGYFSLETGTDGLFQRILAHKAQIPLPKIKKNTLGTNEWDALQEAIRSLDALSLSLVRAGGMTAADIQAVTRQKKFEVIFVDYLQLVQAKGGNRYEQVTSVSLALHTLAQELGVTVIALAQLSRPEKVKGKAPPPNMNSFRESGQIEQDADVAMLLYPADPDDNGSQRILKISKNKDGPKGTLTLDFHGSTQTLSEAKKPVSQQFAEAGKLIKQQQRIRAQETLPGFEEITEPVDLPF